MKTKILGIIVIILVLAGLGEAYSLRLFNRPPKADFSYRTPVRTLKYINPTSDDTILFINSSTDPDGDSLTYSWLIDGKMVNKSRDHMTSLSAGNHTVRLLVSDGAAQSQADRMISVEKKPTLFTSRWAKDKRSRLPHRIQLLWHLGINSV